MKNRVIKTISMVATVCAWSFVSQADVIILDTFTNTSLIGTSPDITPGGEVWGGSTAFSANGTTGIVNRDGTGINTYRDAYLAFTPVAGNIYELSIDYTITSAASANAGFGIGFVTNVSSTAGIFNLDAASMRVLEDGSGQIGMTSGTVGNTLDIGSLGASGTFTIVLNTQSALWTVNWKFNGTSVGSGTFDANPNITDIMIHVGDANATFDNLQLSTIPEPATIGLIVISSAAIFTVRKIWSK